MDFEKFLVMSCGFSFIAALIGMPFILQAAFSFAAGFIFTVWTSS